MAYNIEDYDPAMKGQATITTTKSLSVGGTLSINSGSALSRFYGTHAVATNSATAVNFFGATNGFAGTITGVWLVSSDATAGTIHMIGNNGTIMSITKPVGVAIGDVKSTLFYTGMAGTAFGTTGTIQVVGAASNNATVYASFLTN